MRILFFVALWTGGLTLAAVLIWEGFTAGGSPDPLAPHSDVTAAVLDISVLVFREGLECILVLSAVTAGMVGSNAVYRRPVAAGTGAAALASLITWRIAIGVIDDLSTTISALAIQAATPPSTWSRTPSMAIGTTLSRHGPNEAVIYAHDLSPAPPPRNVA